MYPGMLWWLKRSRFMHGGEAAHAGSCGGRQQEGHGRTRWAGHGGHQGGEERGGFGVRRPLRFLAYKLGLSDTQMAELARILGELKTERAQAAVDEQRSLAAFADAMTGGSFDAARADEGSKQRAEAEERLRKAVLKALSELHQLLDAEQRKQFAYLVRTGVVAL